MRFHLVVLIGGLSVLVFGVGTAAGIAIIDLHQNDTNGVPTLLNQDVTASGVVTVPPRVFDDYTLAEIAGLDLAATSAALLGVLCGFIEAGGRVAFRDPPEKKA